MFEFIPALLLFALFHIVNMHTDENVPSRKIKRLAHTNLKTGDVIITCTFNRYLCFNHVAIYVSDGFVVDAGSTCTPSVAYTSIHKLKDINDYVFVRQLHADVNRNTLRSKLIEFKTRTKQLHYGMTQVNHVFNLRIPGWPGSNAISLNCVSFVMYALKHLGFITTNVPDQYIPADMANLLQINNGYLGPIKCLTF